MNVSLRNYMQHNNVAIQCKANVKLETTMPTGHVGRAIGDTTVMIFKSLQNEKLKTTKVEFNNCVLNKSECSGIGADTLFAFETITVNGVVDNIRDDKAHLQANIKLTNPGYGLYYLVGESKDQKIDDNHVDYHANENESRVVAEFDVNAITLPLVGDMNAHQKLDIEVIGTTLRY